MAVLNVLSRGKLDIIMTVNKYMYSRVEGYFIKKVLFSDSYLYLFRNCSSGFNHSLAVRHVFDLLAFLVAAGFRTIEFFTRDFSDTTAKRHHK